MNEHDGGRLRRWPELDGLRAFAVLSVFLFHAGLHQAGLGFVGVDVFFVLSGFLITALLVTELSTNGQLDLKRFYVRRLLRLYPALVVLVAVLVLLALVLRVRQTEVAQGALFSLLYVSNLWIYSWHETVLLQHTWTLALEEQFYLLWPALLLLVFSRRRRTLWFAGVCAALSIAVALVINGTSGAAAAVAGSYARASGLPLGCALAFFISAGFAPQPGFQRRAAQVSCLAALAVLLLVSWVLGGQLPRHWFDTGVSPAALLTLPVVYAVVVCPSWPVRLILGNRFTTWLGRRSYGFYLWHFPVASVLIHHVAGAGLAVRVVLALALAMAMTALSYRYVETPFLRLKDSYGRRPRRGTERGTSVPAAVV